MTLSAETEALALDEIKAYQARLWWQVTKNDAVDKDIAEASQLWLASLKRLITPESSERMTNFHPITNHDFMKVVIEKWMENWREIKVLHAQLFGLSPETAKRFVKEVLAPER